jgi:primosomal protein N' (replication factor Y)
MSNNLFDNYGTIWNGKIDKLNFMCKKTLNDNKSVLIVAPNIKMLKTIKKQLDDLPIFEFTGIKKRYKKFLELFYTKKPKVVIGLRGNLFAPIDNIGLGIILENLSFEHNEYRFPFYTSMQVMLMRSKIENFPVIVQSATRGIYSEYLLKNNKKWTESGQFSKNVKTIFCNENGLPTDAYQAIKTAKNSVLLEVPFLGVAKFLKCAMCGEKVTCKNCGYKLYSPETNIYVCKMCGAKYNSYICNICGSDKLKLYSIGASTIADQLAHSFKNIPIVTSNSQSGIIPYVDNSKKIVVATPNATPNVINGKYEFGII